MVRMEIEGKILMILGVCKKGGLGGGNRRMNRTMVKMVGYG